MAKKGAFDMPAMRRQEIERIARGIDVADSDDFRKWATSSIRGERSRVRPKSPRGQS